MLNTLQSKLIVSAIEKTTSIIVDATIISKAGKGFEFKDDDIETIQALLFVSLLINNRDINMHYKLKDKLISDLNPSNLKASNFNYKTKIKNISDELRKEIVFEEKNHNHYEISPWEIIEKRIFKLISKRGDDLNHDLENVVSEAVWSFMPNLRINPLIRIFNKNGK